jgi:ABC-2 type transport system ATP-binding protein
MAQTAVADIPQTVNQYTGDVVVETRKPDQDLPRLLGAARRRSRSAPSNLQVKKGEIFRSARARTARGKTTTIKLLLGLLVSDRWRGNRSSGCRPSMSRKNERIGYLPEESYLYRFLNAEETLDFYGRLFELFQAKFGKRASGRS